MNRLENEKSPYLLQHQDNPVEWYAWGQEAFDKAERENKPVFLSIGYSTCHWCHVMAHESFENPEIARLMNEYFVNIKVDREERPDVDRLYMAFVQASTGGGGWPMSVWLTPGGEPFFGGTYFPPDDRHGRPGFPTVIERIAEAWQRERERLIEHGCEVIETLQAGSRVGAAPADGLPSAQTCTEKGFSYFDNSFDPELGGFGDAPKFPRPVTLNLLHRIAASPKVDPSMRARALEMTTVTLRQMAAGGMHDHLGGGFHRYSVDRYWHVPHYEKMLYDQALLARSYLDAFQLTGEEFFAGIAEDIFGYVRRDLAHPGGGFFSAEDADSTDPEDPAKHAEGAFYVWKKAEIYELLGAEAGDWFCRHYGVLPEGNSPAGSDPHGELTGKNTLVAPASVVETAVKLGVEPEELAQSLEKSHRKLFDARGKRPRPHLDDKVLAAWNGLMISAFARGGAVLPSEEQRREASDSAEAAANFILENLWDHKIGLLRTWREGPGSIPAFAEDYAFLVAGLLDLYETTLNRKWLDRAVELQARQDELFWDSDAGGYFSSAKGDSLVRARLKEDYDGAEPSGNSIAAMNLLRLGRMLHETSYEEKAAALFRAFAVMLERAPYAVPELVRAYDLSQSPSGQIVLAGRENGGYENLLRTAQEAFLPNFVLLGNDLESTSGMRPVDGKAAAYVCRDFACQAPVTDPEAFREMLEG